MVRNEGFERIVLLGSQETINNLTSATADFVDPIAGLSRAGDLAALLRY